MDLPSYGFVRLGITAQANKQIGGEIEASCHIHPFICRLISHLQGISETRPRRKWWCLWQLIIAWTLTPNDIPQHDDSNTLWTSLIMQTQNALISSLVGELGFVEVSSYVGLGLSAPISHTLAIQPVEALTKASLS